jgi:hypothetical protein
MRREQRIATEGGSFIRLGKRRVSDLDLIRFRQGRIEGAGAWGERWAKLAGGKKAASQN